MSVYPDGYGVEVTAASTAAVTHLDAAVDSFLRFANDGGDHLGAALSADADLVLGHCLMGYFMRLANDPALLPGGAAALARAREIVAQGAVSARERHHVAALGCWYADDWLGAIAHWERALLENPRDLLALWVSHLVQFFMGRMAQLRDSAARALPFWPDGEPGTAYVHAMYGFALEETGAFEPAESWGRRASTANPDGVWGVHAVTHVLETQSRLREGVAWLADLDQRWPTLGPFANHMWWHRSLYHVELEEFDTVFDLYARGVRPEQTMDYMDISNAASLLWRLNSRGVDVGDRWQELAEKCALKQKDHLLPFSQAHFALVLGYDRRHDDLAKMIEASRALASGAGTVAGLERDVLLPLEEGYASLAKGDYATALTRLLPIRYGIGSLGGSNAQRDVFAQTIIDCALRAKDFSQARALLAERVANLPGSPWSWKQYAVALNACGDAEGATLAGTKAAALLAAQSA
ncbi:MAG: tetratricopeptide repeat protein [Alphaproteobacteria bacterium]|nr:tetratricopeptide repeat protein [Alphaproteobacteria bacterium]